MIAVRPNLSKKVSENKYLVMSYHPNSEKLTTQQKEGSILVDEIPIRPEEEKGYIWRMLINIETEEIEWKKYERELREDEKIEQLENDLDDAFELILESEGLI